MCEKFLMCLEFMLLFTNFVVYNGQKVSVMKNICPNVRRVMLAVVALAIGCATAVADKNQRSYSTTDSVTINTQVWSEVPGRKMATSAFPVKLTVKGNSLRVKSEHNQMLPIYTQGGSLYMNMQLTRGVNWLNGLPRGRYRINNRTIRII